MTREIIPCPTLSPTEAHARLSGGWPMITTSGHLASDWKRRFAQARASSGNSVCETPQAFSWGEWLRVLARRNPGLPLPFSRLQELDLWRNVIAKDRGDAWQSRPQQLLALARQAMRAYAMMCDYAIDAKELLPGNTEHEAFHRWLQGMRREMKSVPDRMLAADLPALLADCNGGFSETHVLLDGFDAPTPAQNRLLAAMQNHGMDIQAVAHEAAPGSIRLSACEDETQELRHAAMHMAKLLQQEPAARIGLFHPSPREISSKLARELETAISPVKAFHTRDALAALKAPAKRLTETPLGCLAIALLSISDSKTVPFSEISPLLLSPYVRGHARERLARAHLETGLRADNQHIIWLPTAITRPAWLDTPEFVQLIRSLLEWDTAPCMASEWTRKLRVLWQNLLGLNERTERSAFEISQINALGEALTVLAALDHGDRPMSWHEFLGLLRQTLADTEIPFPASGQIELLAIEQASGQRFDHVLVLGLDEERWPLAGNPNPFIPVSAQQQAGLPRSTAEQAFAESERLWRHLTQAAPKIDVCYARQREGKEVLPSPMLDIQAQAIERLQPLWLPYMPQVQVETAGFEPVPLTGGKIAGGASGMKDQSACPFRYFAARRLGIKALSATEPGLSAMDRGTLVHRAMELIWARIGNQKALLALLDRPDDVLALVYETIHQAWPSIEHPVDRDVRRLESRRLQGLFRQWLKLEAERPEFTVSEREAWRRWMVAHHGGNLRLSVKLDRVDRDADGRMLILDYKTSGRSSASDWLGERPNEPQLPLYAVIEAEVRSSPHAVAFARIRAGELGFEGLADDDAGIEGIRTWRGKDDLPDKWDELVELWRDRLSRLAGEIVDGRNDVAPRDERACDYCDLKAVCRIDALSEGLA